MSEDAHDFDHRDLTPHDFEVSGNPDQLVRDVLDQMAGHVIEVANDPEWSGDWQYVIHPATLERLMAWVFPQLSAERRRQTIRAGGMKLRGHEVVTNIGMAPAQLHRRQRPDPVTST